MGFVNHLGDVSNDCCNEAKKKTITPEHAVNAMLQLKLQGYVKEILNMKESQSKKPLDMNNKELRDQLAKYVAKIKAGTRTRDRTFNQEANQSDIEEQDRLLNQPGQEGEEGGSIDINGYFVGEDGEVWINCVVGHDQHNQPIIHAVTAKELNLDEATLQSIMQEPPQQQEEAKEEVPAKSLKEKFKTSKEEEEDFDC
jgi:hypothetical protein